MTIQTVFVHEGRYELGEVEVRLLPGLASLQLVGLPDAHIRECGVRLKSAIKARGFKWPSGHQIVVNLRPAYFRKNSCGIDLAIALGYLANSGQLDESLIDKIRTQIVYGELGLDGRVLAPYDLGRAMRTLPNREFLSGAVDRNIREGTWWEMPFLGATELKRQERHFDWESFWQPPEPMEVSFPRSAATALALCTHMRLHVLIAGPQGSGKSTWAKALYSLSPKPDLQAHLERMTYFSEAEEPTWRPFEQPHHSITPLAMVGGGAPIEAGVITRAHGGMLVMDEFLEFHPQVLEALREPLENGVIELARRSYRERLPARFQLIGTTNLCPCGKMYPGRMEGCMNPLIHCRSVCRRLSGPMLDRFDLLMFSHRWLQAKDRVALEETRREVQRMAAFRERRGPRQETLPDWVGELELSHRRKRSLLRVARALADWDECEEMESRHFSLAMELVVHPMEELNQMFA